MNQFVNFFPVFLKKKKKPSYPLKQLKIGTNIIMWQIKNNINSLTLGYLQMTTLRTNVHLNCKLLQQITTLLLYRYLPIPCRKIENDLLIQGHEEPKFRLSINLFSFGKIVCALSFHLLSTESYERSETGLRLLNQDRTHECTDYCSTNPNF